MYFIAKDKGDKPKIEALIHTKFGIKVVQFNQKGLLPSPQQRKSDIVFSLAVLITKD